VNAHYKQSSRRLEIGFARCTGLGVLVLALSFSIASAFAVAPARAAETCPNEVFRTGPSAKLPDCRAYELVTPRNTDGLEPEFGNFIGTLDNVFNTQLISDDGNSVLFQTVGGALSGTPGNGFINRYQTKRTASGWVTELVGIRGDQAISTEPASPSPDQGFYFVNVKNLTSLWAPWSLMIEANFLGTPDGFEPIGRGSIGDDPRAEGKYISENGTHIVFTSTKHLEPDAPPAGVRAVYDRAYGGATHVVSLLPGDVTPTGEASYVAASKDGSEVLFQAEGGPLYLRRNNTETVKVPVPSSYTFAGFISGHVFFTDRGSGVEISSPADLYSYDIATATTTTITHDTKDSHFVNVSADGSRVFFVSLEALTGSEENERGQAAVPPAKGTGTLAGATGSGHVTAASGEGKVIKGSTQVSNLITKHGIFEVGMEIQGKGIPTETKITAVGAETLTLSKPASFSTSGTLRAGSNVVTEVANAGEFEVGMELDSNGSSFQNGTTITAIGSETLILSKAFLGTAGGQASFSAGSKKITGISTSEGQFLPGMAIIGSGIRPGTTITAVGAGTLTLSKAAQGSGVQSLKGGFPNLYVWSRSDESTKFITTVAPEDISSFQFNHSANLANWTEAIGARLGWSIGRAIDHTRSTADGSVLAFESTASLTGFDNTEASPEDCTREEEGAHLIRPGQTCDEVYRYDNVTGELTCISCGTSGPATGEARLQTVKSTQLAIQPVPPWLPVESLSEDGNTVFFETTEALLPRDVNNNKDVYEWEKGKGLSLISTGQDEAPAALYGATPSGSDVLFTTREKLLPQDENGSTLRIYDARANGGFPPPESTVTEPCTGDSCQGAPSAAPPAPETASGSLQAEGGNVPRKLSCAKSKRRVVRRGKEQCVKKQLRRQRHHKRGANR
jgi:hypothetical protein